MGVRWHDDEYHGLGDPTFRLYLRCIEAGYPEFVSRFALRLGKALYQAIKREVESSHFQTILQAEPAHLHAEGLRWFDEYLCGRILSENHDLLTVAFLRACIQAGDAGWIARGLEAVLESWRVAKYGHGVCTEIAWDALKARGEKALDPKLKDHVSMLASLVDYDAPTHLREYGKATELGAFDLDRAEANRRRASRGEKKKPWLKPGRVVRDDDDPEAPDGVLAGLADDAAEDPEAEAARRQGLRILDAIIEAEVATEVHRQLVQLVVRDGKDPGEACQELGLQRAEWNRVYTAIMRAAKRIAEPSN